MMEILLNISPITPLSSESMGCVHNIIIATTNIDTRVKGSLGLHQGQARCVPKSCAYHPSHLPPTVKSLLRNISLATVTRRTLTQQLWSHDWSDWKVSREKGLATNYYQQAGINHWWKCNWWDRLAFQGSDSYCGILQAWRQIYSHPTCQFQSLLNVIMPMSWILLDVWDMNSITFVLIMRNALLQEKPNQNCIWCDMLLPSFCWWLSYHVWYVCLHCGKWQEEV